MSVLQLSSALALAAAAGLNTTLPLLLLGLLARWGPVALPASYTFLRNPLVLAGLAVLALLEFAADKTPLVAHAVHFIQWPLAVLAGALLTATQIANHTASGSSVPLLMLPITLVVWTPLALAVVVLGAVLAGAVHAGRALVRPVASLSTLGVGTAFISALEDVYALLLAGAALLLPLVGLVLLVLLLGLLSVLVLPLLRIAQGIRHVLR